GPTADVADPQGAHELQAGKPAQFLGAPLLELRVLGLLSGDGVTHNSVAEVVNHCRDGECATEPFVQTRVGHCWPLGRFGGDVPPTNSARPIGRGVTYR